MRLPSIGASGWAGVGLALATAALGGLRVSACIWVAVGVLALLCFGRSFYLHQVEKAEESAEDKIDALLRRALDLENTLKYNRYGRSEKKLRHEALALIFEAKTTVEDCLPAFRDDLAMAPAEGSGMTQLRNAVKDCHRVLAAVRKQL